MSIKFLCTVQGLDVTVSVDGVTHPEESAALQYDGPEAAAEELRDWLSGQYGPFGHLIGEVACANDLDHALTTEEAKERYRPSVVEGANLLGGAYPSPPDGTAT